MLRAFAIARKFTALVSLSPLLACHDSPGEVCLQPGCEEGLGLELAPAGASLLPGTYAITVATDRTTYEWSCVVGGGTPCKFSAQWPQDSGEANEWASVARRTDDDAGGWRISVLRVLDDDRLLMDWSGPLHFTLTVVRDGTVIVQDEGDPEYETYFEDSCQRCAHALRSYSL